ncbi:MAG: YggT family protein [Mycobacteriales bacterium]
MTIVGRILSDVLLAFFLLLVFRLVMEYVFLFAKSYRPHGLVLVLLEIAYTVTDPPLKLLRRFIPPLRLGSSGVSIDLAFLVLFLGLGILRSLAAQL